MIIAQSKKTKEKRKKKRQTKWINQSQLFIHNPDQHVYVA